jgi:hypothetical protein
MKTTTLLLAVLFVGLTTMGSSCVNEGFIVAVNVPISKCYSFTASGSNSYDSGPQTVDLAAIVGETYAENLQQSRLYDIKVTYTGPYTGALSGSVFFQGTRLVDFAGNAADFAGGPSLLTMPARFSNLNVTPLLTALGTKPLPAVTVRATVNFAPAPAQGSSHSVCIDVLAQADGKVN